jgi:hypothetical protein
MRHARLLPLAAAALIAAGCGDDDATDAADTGANAAEQARGDLSPEARDILDRSQDIVADIAGIAEGAATGDISGAQAQERLDTASQDAADLADRAEDLPESDAARDRLQGLTTDLERAADDLRAEAEEGQLDQADDVVSNLLDAAQDTYRGLGENLSDETRRQLEDAVRGLGG